MATRKRRFKSLTVELVKKAREAMLSAVQIYNNPQVEFKSELFIVTTVIAWTYLLHSYYRKRRIDYRQVDERAKGRRRKLLHTHLGAVKHWSLERCLSGKDCPLDPIVVKNPLFLIGIRHEIEHQMTTRIDDHLGAKFMAAALNFNSAIKKHFGDNYSLDREQAFSIQFTSIDQGTAKTLFAQKDLPQHIGSFIVQFEQEMSAEEYDDPRFSYRVALVPKTGNKPTTSDALYEIVQPGTAAANEIKKLLLKETEKPKYRPATIIALMKADGFDKFSQYWHTELWRKKDGKNLEHQYGHEVEGTWFWYDAWIQMVRAHCRQNADFYRSDNTVQGTLTY